MKLRLLALLLLPASLFAATLRVNNTPGTSPDYTTIQDAIHAAAEGDTILIEGSTTPYDAFQLDHKRLNLIGPGYFLASNPGTPANKLSAFIHGVSRVRSDYSGAPSSSDGSLIMGLAFREVLMLENCSNVTIARCLFGDHASLRLNGPGNLVSQSFFQGHETIHFEFGANSSGNRIENCIMPIMHLEVNPSGTFSETPFVCYLRNNLVKSINSHMPVNLVVENNILMDSFYGGPALGFFRNNISTQGFPPDLNGSGNIPNIHLEEIMRGFVFGIVPGDSAYVLSPLNAQNPAFNAGTDGTHIGPFGGANPYILSGVPPLPSIDELSVPTFAAPGANLTIRIKVGNRP